MPQAQDAAAYIYQGVWTNWTRGKYLGATLTLSPKNTTVVVSIISIFIQIAGTQLWRILQFALHQTRSRPRTRDGIYHQQQVVLRNSASELGTLWQLLRIAFAWRHQKQAKSYRRSVVLVTWALCHFITFMFLGIFSSRLLDAGDEVLSRSPFCGEWNRTYWDAMGAPGVITVPNHLVVEYMANAQQSYQQTQQYVQFCSNPSAACKTLPQERLTWNWTIENTCPFDKAVCSEYGTIKFDTGLISSHRHLGLNAPIADRVQYRKVTSCTPLNDAGYITDWKDMPATANSPAKRVVDAYYGPNPIADRNATYSHSDWAQYYSFDQYSDTNSYQINVQLAIADDSTGLSSDFIPRPELSRSDADLILVFLSSTKVYEAPINDPWFLAQQAGQYPTHDNINKVNGTVYSRARPVTTLACTEQHQICIDSDAPTASPDLSKCTPLTGSVQAGVAVEALNMTSSQYVTAYRIYSSLTASSFYRILSALAQRDTPLLARSQIQGLVGLSLPDTQWQKETQYWHSIAMASLQRTVIDYATGQIAADTSYINLTSYPAGDWLCRNQIIRSTSYQSFDFFALIMILVFGSIVIVVGFSLEDILALWRKRELYQKGQKSVRQDMWTKNEMLEMLRMLFEWHSPTVWSHSSNGIPVAGVGQEMDIDDLQPCKHQTTPTMSSMAPFQFRFNLSETGQGGDQSAGRSHDDQESSVDFERSF